METRKKEDLVCRGCNSSNLFSGLNLGELPIANELFNEIKQVDIFPLHLRICGECGLGQVDDVVSRERLFSDYRYLSSISETFLNHARKFVNQIIETYIFNEDDWVLEIACNDGYLLQNFVEKGIKVLGIEPALNVANIAKEKSIPVITEFFGSNLASRILEEFGTPKLIIANNVFAHVPNIRDFTEGLSILTSEDTIISIENPSIINILNEMQFDSIYHEHFSYLSAKSVSKLCNDFGLNLFAIEKIQTHGGSNRYWIGNPSIKIDDSVTTHINEEIEAGIIDQEKWKELSMKVYGLLTEFKNFISILNLKGAKIAGYGAAAKASTFINASKIEHNEIVFIIDESPEKIGRFMPSPMIPIVSQNKLLDPDLTHIVIFPWNLNDEILRNINSITKKLEVWSTIPYLRRIQ